MPLEVNKVPLIPRFSTFAAGGTRVFVAHPINVRRFALANVSAWRGPLVPSGASFSIKVQESADLTAWADLGAPLAPSAGQEVSGTFVLELEWIRVAVTVTDGAATCWAVANLVMRRA